MPLQDLKLKKKKKKKSMNHGKLLRLFLEEKPGAKNSSRSQRKVIANIKQNAHLLNSQ